MQLDKLPLPAGEVPLDGQSMHVELAEAPTAVEYVPTPHSVQTADPVDVLYLPSTHAVHVSDWGSMGLSFPSVSAPLYETWRYGLDDAKN